MKKKINDHTFVVLAYKESQYLRECINSLMQQTVESNVIIATSTDNTFIRDIAREYGLQVVVNDNPIGIAGDFDFGLFTGKTKYVTIAHQDDTYEPEYLEKLYESMSSDTIIAFSDYYEKHDDFIQYDNRNLKIKRLMLYPLKIRLFQKSKWVRRRILSLGNPICCPAVTFNKALVMDGIFQSDFRSNMDWKAWEELSKLKGRFVYVPKPLMMHRIHEESTTSEVINDNKRTNEDYRMMCLFWPSWIAKKLAKVYSKSEENNK